MADSTRKTYLDVRPDAVRELFARVPRGPVVMLNLIRLREVADYAATPDLAPTELVSGAAAFDRYVAETLPVLRASGGDLTFLGSGAGFLIGPTDERWDIVMLVRAEGSTDVPGVCHERDDRRRARAPNRRGRRFTAAPTRRTYFERRARRHEHFWLGPSSVTL